MYVCLEYYMKFYTIHRFDVYVRISYNILYGIKDMIKHYPKHSPKHYPRTKYYIRIAY
jgi:hypothetical protein